MCIKYKFKTQSKAAAAGMPLLLCVQKGSTHNPTQHTHRVNFQQMSPFVLVSWSHSVNCSNPLFCSRAARSLVYVCVHINLLSILLSLLLMRSYCLLMFEFFFSPALCVSVSVCFLSFYILSSRFWFCRCFLFPTHSHRYVRWNICARFREH